MSPRTSSRRQAGFTLVELLVVIAIIGVLVALTTAAVQKVREVGKRAQVTSEISQITISLEAFKNRMSVGEVACRGNGAAGVPTDIDTFVLRSNYGEPGGTIDFTNTFEYKFLRRLFPAAELGNGTTASFNNGLPNNVPLDPAHLLVFWLGGYYLDISNPAAPVQVYNQGFNADSRYPFKSSGTPAAKKGPFFEFSAGRLYDNSNRNFSDAAAVGPYRFVDPWGTPYCFFATENSRDNNYAMRATPSYPSNQVVHFDWNGTRIVPLLVKQNQYANQKTFQVFSAGKNKLFPFATSITAPQLWTPGGGATFVENGPGGDDFSNFNPTIMAVQP